MTPAQRPEPNPIEQIWPDPKDDIAWLQLSDIEVQPNSVSGVLRVYGALARSSVRAIHTWLKVFMQSMHSRIIEVSVVPRMGTSSWNPWLSWNPAMAWNGSGWIRISLG